MTERGKSYSVVEAFVARTVASLVSVGIYAIDRWVFHLDEGISIVAALTIMLWWAP